MNKKMLALIVSGTVLAVFAGTAWAAEFTEPGPGRPGPQAGGWVKDQIGFTERITNNTELTEAEKEQLLAAYAATEEWRSECSDLMQAIKAATTEAEKETLRAELESAKADMMKIMEPVRELEQKMRSERADKAEGRQLGFGQDLQAKIQANTEMTEEEKAAWLAAWEQAEPMRLEMETLWQQLIEADAADKEAIQASIQQLQVEIKNLFPAGEFHGPKDHAGLKMHGDMPDRPKGISPIGEHRTAKRHFEKS